MDGRGLSLRELRRAKSWTQPELSKRSGVSKRTICNLETGRGKAQARTRRKLLKALGLHFEGHRSVFGPLVDDYRGLSR